ncbi:unnamed protein product [Miscanthus lutarioriparius]|uniref:Uncharacterized protein n=1 Tax=Miscanthus lutarioriparius TaxID=422564 RepID=A0A811N7W7_9POAL|nr:unnamed protein product [Miscanthus lutarioriparius]
MEQELLKILRGLKSPRHLQQTHAQLLARGLSASPRLLPALVSAAFSVASSSPRHAAAAAILRAAGAGASTVAHNTLIERLAGRGGGRDCSVVDAFAVYAAMRASGVSPNGFTFTFLLRACECLRRLPLCRVRPRTDRQVFDEMVDRDVVSWNSIVGVYMSSEDVTGAMELFEAMPERNVVSWNTVVAAFARGMQQVAMLSLHGYNHNSRYDEALRTFQQMMLEGRFMPDEATLVSVVSACAQLGSVEYCNWISSYISKSNTHITVALGNALIDMFAKCGDVGRARLVFNKMKTRCIITWTAMISGFAYNGQFREALLIYNDMCREGVTLDDTVFVVALAACAHGGLLQEGWSIFEQMIEHYGIVPRMEHYGCIVDLLGRAELTEYVSARVLEIEPFNSSYQVLVSNCSALEGRWSSVMDARRTMRDWGVEKTPGSSLIQVGNEVHEFLAKDMRHQMRKEVYETLDGLIALIRHTEHTPWISYCSTLE